MSVHAGGRAAKKGTNKLEIKRMETKIFRLSKRAGNVMNKSGTKASAVTVAYAGFTLVVVDSMKTNMTIL